MAFLELKDICKSFSGVYANELVSLSVERGEIHALLGENGAGKTTLMNILYGLYHADSGEIIWKGKRVDFHSPREAIMAGIGMVQQHFSLVNGMTVLDNIILNLSSNRMFLDRKDARERLQSLSEKYGLPVDPDCKVSDLSVGERQRVEILKALYRNVELLILDEPTGVLTPQETGHFFEVLRSLKSEGYGIIIITHRMSEIIEISDRVTILRDGRKTADLVTKNTNPEELSYYMIGRSLNPEHYNDHAVHDEKVLIVDNLCLNPGTHTHKLDHVTLDVRKGEILGIAGVEGNGQKELAEVLTGIRKPSAGTISFCGNDISSLGIRKRHEQGMTYISDDRLKDSLETGMNIEDNLALRDYYRSPFSRNRIIRRNFWRSHARDLMQKYQVKASGKSGEMTKVDLMSGGNQQKLIVAREVSNNARLVIASQPTRGLDIGAARFVHEQLIDKREQGGSVLLISADLEELLALCDRIAVIYSGRIVGVLDKDKADLQEIGLLMGGVTDRKEA